MALIVFLRGINVGGHRRFRPSNLAKELSAYDVVNVGAAGTFVVRKPGPRAVFQAELLRKLPFNAEVAMCESTDLMRLEREDPFDRNQAGPDLVRFVSILSKPSRMRPSFPFALPCTGEWLVRVVGTRGRFVFGMYRRHMKTIGYLGQVDKLFGVTSTTRNWNTILAVIQILKADRNHDPLSKTRKVWSRPAVRHPIKGRYLS